MKPIDELYKEPKVKDEEEEEKIVEDVPSGNYRESELSSKYNLSALSLLLFVINGILKKLNEAIESILDEPTKKIDDTMTDILYLWTLVKNWPELVYMVLHTPWKDFLYDPNSLEWENINKVRKIIDFDTKSNYINALII